jgi:hypothetical protein
MSFLVSYNHLDHFIVFLVDLATHFFYLGHFICHLGLLCSFSNNFVSCPSLLDQGHSFDVSIYVVITISFHHLPFVVVIYIISSS